MKKYLVLVALLAGCATPLTYDQQRNLARQDDVDTLCMVTIIKPEYKQAAEDELAYRGASCDWNKVRAMIQARGQARPSNDATMAYGIQMLNNSGPRYMAPPIAPPVRCTTNWLGGTAVTNCQ